MIFSFLKLIERNDCFFSGEKQFASHAFALPAQTEKRGGRYARQNQPGTIRTEHHVGPQ
jgi:hypothetical protein